MPHRRSHTAGAALPRDADGKVYGWLPPGRLRCYFLSTLDDSSDGDQQLTRLSRPVRDAHPSYRGLNFFDPNELKLLLAIARGEFNLRGSQVRDLRSFFPHLNGPQLSRGIKRLRMHKLLKSVHGTYKYYLTRLGRRVIAAGLKLRQHCIIPALAAQLT